MNPPDKFSIFLFKYWPKSLSLDCQVSRYFTEARTLEKEANRWKIEKNGHPYDCLLPWQQSAIYSYEQKEIPGVFSNIHCEFQELKPKVETNSSFLVLLPPLGVDTVNAVGYHLNWHSNSSTLTPQLTLYRHSINISVDSQSRID